MVCRAQQRARRYAPRALSVAGNQEAAYIVDDDMDEYVVGYCRTHVNPYRKGPSV